MRSGNRTNHGASARRKSADSPAEGDNSASGPTGKTDSGESVSDSEPEGKAQETGVRSPKRFLDGRISEVTGKPKMAEEGRSGSSKNCVRGFAAPKSFRPQGRNSEAALRRVFSDSRGWISPTGENCGKKRRE